MKTNLLALTLASALTLTLNTAYADQINFDGWWGFDKNGCNDMDNQYRVAIGRWVKKGEKLEFGKGKGEAIGMYDDYCTLTKRQDHGKTITWSATCEGEEGKSSGEAKIEFVNNNEIKLSAPNTKSLGLIRCDSNKDVKPIISKVPDIDEGCISNTVTVGQLEECRKSNIMRLLGSIDESVKYDLKLKAIAVSETDQVMKECEKKPEDDVLYCMFDELVKIKQSVKNLTP